MRIRAVSHGVKHVARQVQGRSFITTSSTRATSINPPCNKEKERKREEERRGEKGREENGRKSEEKGVRKEDEKGDSKVVKDVTGWTVVARNKRQRKMAQIFVKVNGPRRPRWR